MLPGPCLLTLVLFEGFERHDEHPGSPTRPETRVHFIERACGCGHAESSGDAVRQPVEIIVRPERLRTGGRPAPLDSVEVDDVGVGRVGKRVPAETSQAQYDQLTAWE